MNQMTKNPTTNAQDFIIDPTTVKIYQNYA